MQERWPLRLSILVLMVGAIGCWLFLFAASYLLTMLCIWIGIF